MAAVVTAGSATFSRIRACANLSGVMTRRLILIVALIVGLAAPAWAGFDEGLAAYERGDYEAAFREMKPLAEQGNAPARYNLGLMYRHGQGVPQDYAEAVRWWRKAAEQGDGNGQSGLGSMYYEGKGVPQDYTEAAVWYWRAADQGIAAAQAGLGVMFGRGQGVLPQDYVRAHMWSNLAASRYPPGEARNMAVHNRDELEKVMTPVELAKAQSLAREWRPKNETIVLFVSILQSTLQNRGYDPGPIDGSLGERTRQSMAIFKADMASKGALSDEDRTILKMIELASKL
jgi:TPR repeat protein